ncbi:MAG: hypothetical protein GPJ54_13750 [Candidatus Heimdallarchaeota archaeon]|nr:hypothetical protein [Candidatus Heimdallarchaeota archaeon]
MGIEVVTINIFGVLVSVFSVFVTIDIYRKYRLRTSVFFVISSIAVFIWNILHLTFNFIGENTFSFNFIRFLWLILVYSGIVFVYSFIFGYSNLRYENLNWRLVVYSALASAFIVLFTVKRDWVDVTYNQDEGWITTIHYATFWSLFSISILIVNFLELIIPLVNTYAKAEQNQSVLLTMLMAILLAIFSNALEPILKEIALPQAIRFLVADIGFLIFFMILLRYPFTGLYDNSTLKQVIIADESGVPQLMLSDDKNKAILTSGAIIGINSILEEITEIGLSSSTSKIESTRKIELGVDQFYIVIRRPIIIVFQFQNPTGVCFSKFKSLSRIFSEGTNGNDKIDKKLLDVFETRLKEYFQNFNPTEN